MTPKQLCVARVLARWNLTGLCPEGPCHTLTLSPIVEIKSDLTKSSLRCQFFPALCSTLEAASSFPWLITSIVPLYLLSMNSKWYTQPKVSKLDSKLLFKIYFACLCMILCIHMWVGAHTYAHMEARGRHQIFWCWDYCCLQDSWLAACILRSGLRSSWSLSKCAELLSQFSSPTNNFRTCFFFSPHFLLTGLSALSQTFWISDPFCTRHSFPKPGSHLLLQVLFIERTVRMMPLLLSPPALPHSSTNKSLILCIS